MYKVVKKDYQIWVESTKKFHLVMLQITNGNRFALLEFGNFESAKHFVRDFVKINK